eukprot:1529843-Amphidinium_carterae.1
MEENRKDPLPSNYNDYRKGKKGGEGDNYIVCYFCGKPGHTSDKCWYNNKGQVYNMEQPTPVWSMPNDNQTMNLQQQASSQSATTTIMTQPNQQQQPPSITIYDQQQYVRAVTDGAILV